MARAGVPHPGIMGGANLAYLPVLIDKCRLAQQEGHHRERLPGIWTQA